jgi:hypothetical protein
MFQRMLKLNSFWYSTSMFTVYWLFVKQRTLSTTEMCIFVCGVTSNFEVFQEAVNIQWVQGQTEVFNFILSLLCRHQKVNLELSKCAGIIIDLLWPGVKFLRYIFSFFKQVKRLSGLVVRVPGYRFTGPGFDSRRNQIFWEVVSLERGLLSLVRIIEELLEWNSGGSGIENRN